MNDPYLWYVIGAYGSGLILVGGLTLATVLHARRTRAALEAEDARR